MFTRKFVYIYIKPNVQTWKEKSSTKTDIVGKLYSHQEILPTLGARIMTSPCKGGMTEVRGCVKIEVAVLGSPSLISLTVSVDGKQHFNQPHNDRAQELCENRGGRPGLPVPNKPYGFCGRKAALN